MIARADAKLLGALLVVRERHSGDLVELVRFKWVIRHRGVSTLSHYLMGVMIQVGVETARALH